MRLLPNSLESASYLDLLLIATVAVALIWIALRLFVWWRRRATNLTPVGAARINPSAQPGFLTVDHEARAAALRRADEFEARLAARDRDARRAAPASRVSRLAAFASLAMSVFSLATMVAGAIWQVSWIGNVVGTYSTPERVVAVLKAHPIAVAVCLFVIGYQVVDFFAGRKWNVEADLGPEEESPAT